MPLLGRIGGGGGAGQYGLRVAGLALGGRRGPSRVYLQAGKAEQPRKGPAVPTTCGTLPCPSG